MNNKATAIAYIRAMPSNVEWFLYKQRNNL